MDLEVRGNKPTIFVDCDDVIIGLAEVWIEELNKIYGSSVKVSDITQWHFNALFNEPSMEKLCAPLYADGVWTKVKPKKDAIKYLKRLKSEGYEIYIVTATDYRNVRYKFENVFHKYFHFIDDKHIIICSNKQLLGDNNSVLIDDNPDNLVNGRYRKILFRTSHNIENKYNLPEAQNWNDCYNMIHKYRTD